jgi:hypothetical protein
MEVRKAKDTPTTNVIAITPDDRIKVFCSNSGSRLFFRWFHIPGSWLMDEMKIIRIGISTAAVMSMLNTIQGFLIAALIGLLNILRGICISL